MQPSLHLRCDFGQGRVGVQAPARPAHSDILSDLLLSSSLALAKMFSLVGLDSSNVLRRPTPMLSAIHPEFFGRWKLSRQHAIGATSPSEFRPAAPLPSSNTSSSLRLCLYNLCCQVKSALGRVHSACADPSQRKHIAECTLETQGYVPHPHTEHIPRAYPRASSPRKTLLLLDGQRSLCLTERPQQV